MSLRPFLLGYYMTPPRFLLSREPLAEGRTAVIYPWEDGRVIKVFREGWGMDTAEWEAEIGRIVHATGVAAPEVFDIHEIDGRAALVYERVDGQTLLQAWQQQLWRVGWMGRVLADLHVAMHERTVLGLWPQREHLRRKLNEAAALPDDLREVALKTLESLPLGDALCHNDFHPDNIMVTARGAVIIDWTDATQGHPLADVARTWVLIHNWPYHMPSLVQRMVVRGLSALVRGIYLRRYRRLRDIASDQVVAWIGVVAAARLSEEIAAEEAALIKLAERYLRQA